MARARTAPDKWLPADRTLFKMYLEASKNADIVCEVGDPEGNLGEIEVEEAKVYHRAVIALALAHAGPLSSALHALIEHCSAALDTHSLCNCPGLA